jgi:tetratricopeptide (TPR) repeat protein
MKRIRERSIAEEVALALDDWGRVRRKVHGAKSEKAENLLFLAMDLDPDPARQQMRQAIADNDLDVLLELAAPENLPKLAPGSIFVLSAALWDGFPEHKPDVYRMYDQALHLYPGDYVLQSVGGTVYDVAGRTDSALMCRSSALSIRPNDSVALYRLGESLSFTGRLTDAEGAFRASIAGIRAARVLWSLGVVQSQLGDRASALASYTSALAIREEPDLRADWVGMRYLLGLAPRDELQALASVSFVTLGLVNTLYPLLDHPRSGETRPAVRPAHDRRARRDPAAGRGVLRARLGRPHPRRRLARRLAAIEGHYYQSKLQLVTPNAFDFMRSLIYSKLGNAESARECYARGVAEWNVLTAGNPAAWEKSDVMRWRRDAEAALAQ